METHKDFSVIGKTVVDGNYLDTLHWKLMVPFIYYMVSLGCYYLASDVRRYTFIYNSVDALGNRVI